MKDDTLRTLLKTGMLICLANLLFIGFALAQVPQNIPKPDDNEPLRIDSTATFIIFIAIPLAAILLYFILKGKRKRDNRKGGV